jgi:hypothetical protein
LDKNPRKIQSQFNAAARLFGPHARILASLSGKSHWQCPNRIEEEP